MTGAGAGRRPRKVRPRRNDLPPPGTMLVIRALPAGWDEAVDDIADAALDMAGKYVDEAPDGHRELLFSISVFERRPHDEPDVLSRFPTLPLYAEITVEAVQECGFDVLPMGSNERHYELQLLPGVLEADWPEDAKDRLRRAAAVLLRRAEPFKSNPVYPGEVVSGPETP